MPVRGGEPDDLNRMEEEWNNRLTYPTGIFNPAWLRLAHQRLDAAVLAAYGWEASLEDEELLARLLALNLEREAVARGARHLTLEVRMSNEPAQAMYRRFGFHPAGVRKNYYVETNEDALVMWADDIDTDEYAERLSTIEAGVPGTTVIEDA